MENHFYAPLNVAIFITHVRNLRNGCYAEGRQRVNVLFILGQKDDWDKDICPKTTSES